MSDKKTIVVLSGAGISAESGIQTFRDNGGLWEGHDVQQVATPEAWEANRELVLKFYNERRRSLLSAKPNAGHLGLAALENNFQVEIVTQNVDDLHERAGSSSILHLHGELRKSRSTLNPSLVYNIEGSELSEGDLCEQGSQLRPHIVWFGEAVPAMDQAVAITRKADILVIIGTSLAVYPAASLIDYARVDCQLYLIDPKESQTWLPSRLEHIQEGAGKGVEILKNRLLKA